MLAAAWGAAALLSVAVPGPTLGPTGRRAGSGPRVSVIVPLRDEAATVDRCMAALGALDHPDLEIVAVDDRSHDGTAARLHVAAASDERIHVVEGRDLPEGWVGKPWACHQGAEVATGDWLVFLDADAVLHPEAIAALIDDADTHAAQVVSWVGHQELVSIAERVVNPCVFFFIAALTPLPLAQSSRTSLVAVNGQFLAFRREAYQALGGHAAVRDAVVEDLALGRAAKARFAGGYRFVWVRDLLATRMYDGWPALRRGWSKNLALGGAAVGIPPSMVVVGALVGGLGPWLGWAARRSGADGATCSWPLAAVAQVVALGVFGRRFSGQSPAWGLSAPLGQLGVTAIAAESWWRTRTGRITWRGRTYAARR